MANLQHQLAYPLHRSVSCQYGMKASILVLQLDSIDLRTILTSSPSQTRELMLPVVDTKTHI